MIKGSLQKKIGFLLLTVALSFNVVVSNAEAMEMPADITVQGTVTASEDHAGLPGVNVLVKGTTLGTSTDSDGKFTINVPDQNSVLVFSFIGFKTQEITVGSRTTIDVTLLSDINELSEIVVVGYGEQKRSDIT